MAPLDSITYTVQMKPPIPSGDKTLGSPVYSPGNREGGPLFYKEFMDCIYAPNGTPFPTNMTAERHVTLTVLRAAHINILYIFYINKMYVSFLYTETFPFLRTLTMHVTATMKETLFMLVYFSLIYKRHTLKHCTNNLRLTQ
jgi:hypothetical protein